MKRTILIAGALLLALSPLRAVRASQQPAVIALQVVSATRAAQILRRLYPRDRITVESRANAIIVLAPAADVDAMRQIAAGIDVKSPTADTVDAFQLHHVSPDAAIGRLRALFPHASMQAAPNGTVLISANAQDAAQIKMLMGTFDTPPETPSPKPEYSTQPVRMSQGSARLAARVIAHTLTHTRVAVSGDDLLLTGPQEEVDRGRQLAAQLDHPSSNVRYTQLYRLRFVDAKSVAEMLQRSFGNITVEVDKDLNAITVLGTYAQQNRIADAIAQLDANPAPPAGSPQGAQAGSAAFGEEDVQVVNLHAALPGPNGAPSTSASDIAQTLSTALQSVAPDLHVTVPANGTQLVLTGSQYSIKIARHLVEQLDVAQPLVVLDTEILEVDETVAKNLGLQFSSPVISSTFSEIPPAANAEGVAPPLMGIQGFSRTPLSLGLQINLLVQRGQARILADPRITVVSGRTANIRAGDSIAILTTTGGGAGTVATTQLQTFQTGVSLDITPVINVDGYITVELHPTVNSLEGILNGVPQIATRDAQTTVGLKEDETLVIGGLIQDTTNRTDSRVPVLGDLPLVGKIFRNDTVNSNRNELIVTVTPHIVRAGEAFVSPGPPLPSIPVPEALPTLAPGTRLPPPRTAAPPQTAPTPTPRRSRLAD